MAAYGAQIKAGKTQPQALDYLKQLFGHVEVQDPSAAASLQTFSRGVGDVLISYENEAIAARDHADATGQAVDWVVPDATILIENPIAVVTSGGHARTAKAFVDFLRTKPAQEIFAKHGYRPVVDGVGGPNPFPTPSKLFTIADLGGWPSVTKTFFDPQAGLIVPLERAVGISGG
jgi:ABC-type sulfate transport system substrate-binding protein